MMPSSWFDGLVAPGVAVLFAGAAVGPVLVPGGIWFEVGSSLVDGVVGVARDDASFNIVDPDVGLPVAWCVPLVDA